jgi:outer membrane receptor protein involved in Fe transport
MRFNYIYALLILGMALFFAPANAQTKKKTTKKATTKTVAKKPAPKPAAKKPAPKPVAKPAATKKPVTAPVKSSAQKLGDAAAKVTQDTTQKGGAIDNASLSEEIVVTTAYKPVLADAVKIRRNPNLEDKIGFKAPLSYKPLDKRLERNTDIKQMEAVKMPAERDSDLYNNLVKAGLGSMKTTFGELYINNGRDDALQPGAYLKHFAQSGSSYNKQSQSKDEVGVFGKSVGETNSIRGRITYNRVGTNFYGYNQFDPPPTLDVAKQHFNTIGAEGELTKNFKDVPQDFTYAVKLNGYLYNNAFHAKENNVVLSGFINQTIKQFYAGLNITADLGTQKDSTYSISNNIVKLNPYLKFQGDNYKIDAGVNLVRESGFNSRSSIFPAARLEVQVIPKYLRLFAEAKGDVNKSSLRDFSEINPYLGQNIAIKNSVDQLDIAAGLKGTIAPGLGFKASVFRNDVKNMPLMVSDFNFAKGYNRYTVIYDGGKARVSGFNGELDYKASDDVDIFGRMELKDYKMATEAQAWNLPKFKLTAGTNLQITDKIKLNGSLIFRGDTKDRVADPAAGVGAVKIVSIASFTDINAGAEYKVNKRVGIFVQANNLLNVSYQPWLYYPAYGFNIMGGVSYGF